ncbi:MAG: T9SS type A sorting domain-containing protein [Chitinophagales bacterium]
MRHLFYLQTTQLAHFYRPIMLRVIKNFGRYSATTDTLFLRGISMGRFTHLKNKVNTAIPKSSKKYGFSLYPNPSQNTLIVQLQNQNMVFPLTYTIYDSLGKLILSDAITELQYTIDISSIAQGWYQLQLTKNGQHLDTKSFIKM